MISTGRAQISLPAQWEELSWQAQVLCWKPAEAKSHLNLGVQSRILSLPLGLFYFCTQIPSVAALSCFS